MNTNINLFNITYLIQLINNYDNLILGIEILLISGIIL